MSSSECSNNENRKLFASKRHLYADKHTKPCEKNIKDCDLIPRHRIAGKSRMPPYIEAPTIKVPEAKPPRSKSQRRSKSRTRITSQERIKTGPQATCEEASCVNTTSEIGDICRSAQRSLTIQEPLLVNDALVMVMPRSYVASGTHAPSSSKSVNSAKNLSGKGKTENVMPTLSCVTNPERESKHILEQKVPPLYKPRPCHEVEDAKWDTEVSAEESSDSDQDNKSPWGSRVTGVKVSRVQRDFDDDIVSIDTPEGTIPVCGRCGVAVYLAEERRAAGRKFHSSCFKCFLCNASLDSGNLHERNQEIYCKSCYIRQFGPKGYDYGPGEGALRIE